jgi:hypothetical protein
MMTKGLGVYLLEMKMRMLMLAQRWLKLATMMVL